MGGYGNPTIALGAKPPEPISVTDAYMKALQARNLNQESQIRDVQLQEAQDALKEQQIARKAYMDSDPKDPEDLFRKLRQYGAKPSTELDMRTKMLTAQKAMYDRDEAKNKSELATNDRILGLFTGVDEELKKQEALPKEQRDYTQANRLFNQALQGGVQQKLFGQDEAYGVLRDAMPNGFDPDAYRLWERHFITHSAWLKQTLDQQNADARTKQADVRERTLQQTQFETAKKDASASLGAAQSKDDYAKAYWRIQDEKVRGLFPHPDQWSPEASKQALQIGMTPYEVSQAQKPTPGGSEDRQRWEIKAGQLFPGQKFDALTPTDKQKVLDAVDQDKENLKLAAEQAKNEYPADYTKTGQEFLDSMTSRSKAAMVKAIAEYRQPPLAGWASGRPEGQALMGAVNQYNPAYNATMYDARRAMRVKMTTDPKINSINTALLHSAQMDDVAKSLANGSFKPGNAAYNWFVTQFGAAPPNNFNIVKQRVAGELTNSLVAAGGSDRERKMSEDGFSNANSPEQLMGAVRMTLGLLGSKLAITREQWQAGMGVDDKTWDPLFPTARKVLEKYGFDPEHPQLMSQVPIRTVTMADLQAIAKQYNKPIDQVVKDAKTKNWVISDEPGVKKP